MGGTVTGPIEYFVWANQNSASDKLVYYDDAGSCIERSVKTGEIEHALKVFDGRRRAVRRSTGGLTLVEPYQIVLVSHADSPTPNVRIRVRFNDVRFVERNGLLVAEEHTHTKVVTPEELREPFDYHFGQRQNFVVDFGHGIIPVHVVHYDTDASGNVTAFFVDNGEMAKALSHGPGEGVWIQPYKIPRSALRWAAEPMGTLDDQELARENYARLVRVGAEIMPQCLKEGEPIPVATTGSKDDVRDFLALTLTERRRREDAEPLMESLLTNDEETYPLWDGITRV